MKKTIYFSLFFCLLGLTTCVEPINFDRPDALPLVVAFGTFTSGSESHELSLKYTEPRIGSSDFVENATVLLREKDSDATWNYFYANNRYHLFNYRGEAGKTYRIEITLSTGFQYYSNWQVMPSNHPDARLHHTISDNTVRIFADIPLPDENVYLRFPLEEDYSFPEVLCFPLDPVLTCYFHKARTAQYVPIFTNESATIDTLDDFLVHAVKPSRSQNMEYRLQHYFSVFVHTISKEAHDYWRKVNQVGNLAGDIFDPIPAAVKGNLYNVNDETDQLLGFFEVAAVDTIRTVIIPSDFPETFFLDPFCKPIVGGIFPDGFNFSCCNCATLEGAGSVKPYWF